MTENLLRIAQCSLEGSKGVWELVVTDDRSIFVHRGDVKTPSLWWGLGGAGAAGLAFLFTKQDLKSPTDPSVKFDQLASAAGNIVVPHRTVRGARLERGFAVWKSLTLEYEDNGVLRRVKSLVAAPESYVQARRSAGIGRLESQREFIHGLRADLWKSLPPESVVKDLWK